MATTSYYTVNGRIRGEGTGGAFRRYGRDALGSVVRTFDSTGVSENTYRYNPYGELLAKTGSAGDPDYTWAGAHGYRRASRSFAEVYVRARTYSGVLARWASVDRLWPKQPAYGYVLGNPVGPVDASGRSVHSACVDLYCGQ